MAGGEEVAEQGGHGGALSARVGCREWQHQQSYSPQSLELANWNKLRIRTGSWCIPSMAFKSGDGDKKAHATNEAQLIFPHAGMKSVCFGNDDDYFLCGISKNNLREVAKKFKRDSSTFYIIPG